MCKFGNAIGSIDCYSTFYVHPLNIPLPLPCSFTGRSYIVRIPHGHRSAPARNHSLNSAMLPFELSSVTARASADYRSGPARSMLPHSSFARSPLRPCSVTDPARSITDRALLSHHLVSYPLGPFGQRRPAVRVPLGHRYGCSTRLLGHPSLTYHLDPVWSPLGLRSVTARDPLGHCSSSARSLLDMSHAGERNIEQ